MNKSLIFIVFILVFGISFFALLKTDKVQRTEPEKPQQVEVLEPIPNEQIVLLPSVPQKKVKKDRPQKKDNTEIVNKTSLPVEEKKEEIIIQQPKEEKREDVKVGVQQKVRTFDSKRYTSEPELVEALNILEDSGEKDALKNIQKYAMRIKFDDFAQIYYNKDSYYAMTAYNRYGTRLILINSKYKTSPVEQLACVIVHESVHTRMSPTLEEENLATKREAACWRNLKSYSKTYPDTKLTRRLDAIAASNERELAERIANTEVYKEQFNIDKP